MISLVTGHTGTEHVTSGQVGRFNAALHGKGNYILDVGDKCQVDVIDSKKIRINKGELMCQGRHISIEAPEEMTITGGILGQTTYALVYIHYEISETGIESVGLKSKKIKTETSYDVSGSILDGSSTADIPFASIKLKGYNVESAQALMPIAENLESAKASILKEVLNGCIGIVDESVSDVNNVRYYELSNGIQFEYGYVILDEPLNLADGSVTVPLFKIEEPKALSVTVEDYYGNSESFVTDFGIKSAKNLFYINLKTVRSSSIGEADSSHPLRVNYFAVANRGVK
jgi:hypothetical protein